MFDTLVESRTDAAQSAKSSAYFGVTTLVMAAAFMAIFVWSLYSYNVGLGEEDLALSTLVAPVPVPDAAPPPPAPEKPQEQKAATEDAPKNFDTLRDPIASIEDTREAVDTSVQKSTGDVVRRGVDFKVGDSTSRAINTGTDAPVRTGDTGTGGGVAIKPTQKIEEPEDAPPPPKKEPPKVPSVVSGGVVNGKASRLVQPTYPPAAKAVKAAGTVNVQVTIDENGNVISASATSGHPLLRAAAVSAARSSKFTPTKLSGQPVKVTGVIVYNFVQ